MEHYRSTLAITAIAVFGLVAAAHSLHPGNYEMQARPARPVVAAASPARPAVAASPAAWIDPPARIAAPETTGAIRPNAGTPDIAAAIPSAVPAPQAAAVVPPDATPAPPLPGEMARPAAPLRKAAASHRPRRFERAAHRVARLRHPALARTAAIDRAAVGPVATRPAQAASDSSGRIDPIGDILRGLGFGRDG